MHIKKLTEAFDKLAPNEVLNIVDTEYGILANLVNNNDVYFIVDADNEPITIESKNVYEVLDNYIDLVISEEAQEDLLYDDNHFFGNEYSQYVKNKLQEMSDSYEDIDETYDDIITIDEMKELRKILTKLTKVINSAYKDGDFDRSNFNKLNKAISIIDNAYGYSSREITEEVRLADAANPDLEIGDFYMADNTKDLISGLDKLTLGDSIGIINGDIEVTINLIDENKYDFIVDNGVEKNNWELEDNGPVFHNVNKEDVLKLIRLVVK